MGPDGERTVLKAIPNELGGSFSLDGKTNTFNGTVVEYGSNGAPKVLKVFERGTLIDESPLQEVGKERELSGREFWEPLRDWDDPNYNGRVSIFVERYTDVYFDRNGNGIPELSEYGYPVYNGGGWEYVEYGHQDYIPISNDAFHRHDWSSGGPSTALNHNNENTIEPPSCESFNYSRIGNTNWLVIVTILFVIVLYILGVEKNLTSTMEWKSFKIDPKVLIVSVLLYGVVLYILYKIKI